MSNDILIFPNPTNNILNISSLSKIMYLEIYNSLGQDVVLPYFSILIITLSLVNPILLAVASIILKFA